MKKYVVIVATLVLLLLVFAPATYAAPPAQEGYGSQGGGYGGGYGGGGWGWNQGTWYRVRYGDNLFRIGLRHGVHHWEIARVNGIRNPNWIYAGQWLYIPPSRCCWQGHHNPWSPPYQDGNPVGYHGGWGHHDGYGGNYNSGYGGY